MPKYLLIKFWMNKRSWNLSHLSLYSFSVNQSIFMRWSLAPHSLAMYHRALVMFSNLLFVFLVFRWHFGPVLTQHIDLSRERRTLYFPPNVGFGVCICCANKLIHFSDSNTFDSAWIRCRLVQQFPFRWTMVAAMFSYHIASKPITIFQPIVQRRYRSTHRP